MKKKPNATAFVLSFPDRPAGELVELAKKRGIELSARYVYVIRSIAKTKGRRAGKVRRGNAGEAELRRAIADLGLARSREILAEVERSFR